ncbi:hypothetical protein [Streptomyces sp. S1D4-14]|uniref:hypothetical protein n=1 Tax=Streptomyces sp. S1D4-14 TaxID=2594461 RepID=UPI001164D63C|nr:hypothetical protein [Streptomyces sp. S1D4-14]QDN64465.1 hypothetical protein FNV66_01125 [Streptomyces sp. S1D4-14]
MNLHRIAPAAVLLGLLTACGTSTSPAPSTGTTRSVERPAVDPTPTPTEDETALIVDITWAGTSESRKDAMCAGIALYGTQWAADQMRQGAGTESVDWEQAAVIVQHKCEQR